ncbi:hypothetical protein [Actinocrispum sp. NPDC049592]|uniref:hypothetical protein n=1 Tax=Actinocrispum sp. NPDC049592 TaxID=3154835 RepID=UPI00341BFF03
MRKTGLLAAGLALSLALVGCGSKTAGTPTAGGDTTGGATAAGEPGGLKVFGNALDLAGAVNSKSKDKQSVKFSIDGSAAGQAMKGDGAFRVNGTDVAMQMKMDLPGMGAMEMVIVDKAFYMKIPASLAGSQGIPADKPWIKFTADGDDPLSKMLGPMLEQMGGSFDISKQMDQLKNAGTIDKSEKTTLDGAEVTHYWMTIDTLKALEATNMDPELKKQAEAAAKQSGGKTQLEMWINSDNLPVQIVTEMKTAGQSVKMTAKYTDWGKPVDIKAPADSEVTTMPK